MHLMWTQSLSCTSELQIRSTIPDMGHKRIKRTKTEARIKHAVTKAYMCFAVHKDNFGMIPFPAQYEYRVSDVDIYSAEALQLLAS